MHVDSGGDWRGGQRQLLLLAEGQREAGAEPVVVGQPRSRLVLRARGAGLASSAVRMRNRWDITSVRRIRRLVRIWSPPVVHTHDLTALSLVQAALVGIPGISIVHTARSASHPTRTLRRAALRGVYFTVPNAAAEQYVLSSGVPGGQIFRIPPMTPPRYTDPPRDWRAECSWPGDTVVCGVIGSSHSRNTLGVRNLIHHLPSDVRPRLRIVVFGGNVGQSTILGVQLYGAGYVDDIGGAISGLDLLASLSGPESMNTAVLEALVNGVPSVAFDAGGGDEYTLSGRCGTVVRWRDLDAFAAAVAQLVRDDSARLALSAEATAIRSTFGREHAVAATATAYAGAREALLLRSG